MINILYTSRQNLAKAQRLQRCLTTAGCGPSGRPSYITMRFNGRPLTLPSRPCSRINLGKHSSQKSLAKPPRCRTTAGCG